MREWLKRCAHGLAWIAVTPSVWSFSLRATILGRDRALEGDALLAAGVHVPSGSKTHGIDDLTIPIRDQPTVKTAVRIGRGGWIGSAAIVMADVGADAVVAAGAVVTRPIPDATVAGGVPARVLRHRDPRLE